MGHDRKQRPQRRRLWCAVDFWQLWQLGFECGQKIASAQDLVVAEELALPLFKGVSEPDVLELRALRS